MVMPDKVVVDYLKVQEVQWLQFLSRTVKVPPTVVSDVLGLGPVKYDILRSARIAPLVSSLITFRKVLCFSIQDLNVELPSQFADIQHVQKDVGAFVAGELTTFLGSLRRSVSLEVKSLIKIMSTKSPRFKFPTLWTSSFSGRHAWCNLSKDPILASALKLIGVTYGEQVLDNVKRLLGSDLDSKILKDGDHVTPKGRIAILREYGGKIRCFAIPSALSQMALYPIHKQIFKLFRSLSSDYTFNQNLFRIHLYSGK
jgi:hypothetical protein